MDDASLFRFPPAQRTIPVATGLDWSGWDVQNDPLTGTLSAPGSGGDPARGFAKAVEMCNNNGHCRKFDAGTMCPSYRVTRDEIHLTRGRANTLRHALSGAFGPSVATADVRAALDLCVGCKGCRRECPTGVDMARMKIEFEHQWQREHGTTFRDRLVAFLPHWAPFAARAAPLLNQRDRLPAIATLLERPTGIAARRSLPRWRRDTFAGRTQPLHGDADVVLFVDTFTRYFEPENAEAALRVLRAAGRRVTVAAPDAAAGSRPLCCGRTFLAHGLVDEARREAARMLDALSPHVGRGAAIVGLEPSCLLTLRDEFLALGLGERAHALASRAMLIEEFLVQERDAGRLDLPLDALADHRALVHGHCHQKAFGAAADVVTMLRWIPGLDVEAIESSCCGMAGAFGYGVDHYDVSLRMAELSLLPAVRTAADDTLIVADGTSCRHQIADGTRAGAQRRAVHAVRVLDRALRDAPNADGPAGTGSDRR
jgi:Fe-S oxidoreductase